MSIKDRLGREFKKKNRLLPREMERTTIRFRKEMKGKVAIWLRVGDAGGSSTQIELESTRRFAKAIG